MKIKPLFEAGLSFLMATSLLTIPINAASYDVTVQTVEPTLFIKEASDSTKEHPKYQNDVAIKLNNAKDSFSAWAKIYVGEDKPYVVKVDKKIEKGANEIVLPVTDTREKLKKATDKTTLKIELYDNESCKGNAKAVYETNEWERTRHWEVYFSQTMHTDIGFTDYQEDLKKKVSDYLDEAQKYVDESKNRKDTQEYKYMVESGWDLGEAYMKNRNAEEIEKLTELIKEEMNMSITAGLFNYTTETFNTEELARATYYTNRYLVDSLGIDPSELQNMFDNPSFSKSYIDTAVEAGIKYGFHSMNQAHSPYHKKRQYDIFYMQGNNPKNKMLVYNGYKYSVSFGFDNSVEKANSEVLNVLTELQNRPEERGTGLNPYPYDKFCFAIVPYGDNAGPRDKDIQIANELNKKWEEAGYVYPKIKVEFQDTFMKDVETEFGPEGEDIIDTVTGTEENWWNDGWGTTAYESGINKEAGNLLSSAEKAASFAALSGDYKYPIDDLNEAVNRNLTYDEHTWGMYGGGAGSSDYHKQFEWKRSNAFGTKSLSEKVLDDSLQSLSKQVKTTEDKSIYVYNSLNWVRDDVVNVKNISDIPTNFKLYDGEKEVPYTMNDDGTLTFVAKNVPALGYKVFTIKEVKGDQVTKKQEKIDGNVIENEFYKVTFADDGTIASIIDKVNGNREIVDNSSNAKFNQYQYYDDFGVPGGDYSTSIIDKPDRWKHYTPDENAAKLVLEENNLGKTAKLDTSTFRAGSIIQTVTLYDGIPRIDISNEVVKDALPNLKTKEEAYYTFPFKASENYKIQYDLPSGNTGEGEQVYGTSTDFYTANKWVNVKDGEYNMTLAMPNTSLLMFGERRLGEWSFDYKSENPYIYSWVMNNFWDTNFQRDQPGYVNFKYSISTNVDTNYEKTSVFGEEISNPLQATVIKEKQENAVGGSSGNFISIDQSNVQLSTMKYAEANGDGMIIRFHEATGRDSKVTVTLPYKNIIGIYATDIIENDKERVSDTNTFSFDIKGYDYATFRVKFKNSINAVTQGSAVTDSSGTKITWNNVDGAKYYEVFRSSDENDDMSKGGYLGSTTDPNFFDTQVVSGLSKPYYYKIRAVGTGVKADLSDSIKQQDGQVMDTNNPNKPILDRQVRSTSQIDLWWTPVKDDIAIQRYDIYRNGNKIGSTPDYYVTSYRDKTVKENNDYTYTIKAVDVNDKVIESNAVFASTKVKTKPILNELHISNGTLNNKFDPTLNTYDIYFGNKLEGVRDFTITPISNDPDVEITINGDVVESGKPSKALSVSEDDQYVIKVTKGEDFRVYTLYPTKHTPIITAYDATAGSVYRSDKTPINTINNSGMTGTKSLEDLHDADSSANTMWHTASNPGEKAWIQYDLGDIYKLDELYIWNMNQGGAEINRKRALKNVKIEYSKTGVDGSWVELSPEEDMVFPDAMEGYPFQLAPTKGEANMPATNLNDGKNTPVRFNGKEARFVKITAAPVPGEGTWGDVYYGLSEVRFTSTIDRDIYKKDLQNLVDECAVIIENKKEYLERNWDAFENAYQIAKEVLTNDKATQTEIDEAEKSLFNAKENLVKKPTVKNPVIPALSATAGSTYNQVNQDPMHIIDGSGMSDDSLTATHDNQSSARTMWHTVSNPEQNAWIQVDLGEIYELDEMWIWNMNQESNMTRGLKNVKIEYSEDNQNWKELLPEDGIVFTDPITEGYPFQFTKASGNETIKATNLNDGKDTPVRFNGEKARYVKITAAPTPGEGSWGDVYYGLSELRFTQKFKTDKTALQELIEMHEKKENIGYTDESWAAFEEALLHAKDVYDKIDASQDEIDKAYQDLADAVVNLVLKPIEVNKEKLINLYEKYKDYKQGDYTESSWTVFEEALANAKNVLDDSTVTQKDVDLAVEQLESAVAGLERGVHKERLQEAYNKYKDLQQGNYTDTTWGAFNKARSTAKDVLNDPNATQDEIDKALKDLEMAFNNLSTESPQEPENPIKPIDPSEKPEEPEKPISPDNKPNQPNQGDGNKQTSGGDTSNVGTSDIDTGYTASSGLMAGICIISLGMLVLVLKKRKRESEK